MLKGLEGTGKGTLAKVLLRMLGQHGLQVSNPKHLVGAFNGHLRDCVFLFADEAFFAGDKQNVGVLKSLITERYLAIEAKFQNAVQMRNRLHILMASNDEWVVPASREARRFFVLQVPNTVRNDLDYFDAIAQQMEAGGYEGMLHDLLAYDLTGFNFRKMPVTAALQEQKKLSLQGPESWWLDVLQRGYVGATGGSGWREKVTTDELFDSYLTYMDRTRRHERQLLSRETLGRFMKRTGAVPKRIGHERVCGYRLGSLDIARVAFALDADLNIEWQGEGAEVEANDEGDTFTLTSLV